MTSIKGLRFDAPLKVILDENNQTVAALHNIAAADDPTLGPKMAAAPEMFDALDPDTLDAIADEIDCFAHSARSGSLRYLAKKQRAALAAAGETK